MVFDRVQLDYCPGGEVFTYLRRARRFNETTARFYAAEIALILEFLHDVEGTAYRDLKPENILIDSEGHLKLVDFGFAKKIGDSTSSSFPANQPMLTLTPSRDIHPLRHARVSRSRGHQKYRYVASAARCTDANPLFRPQHRRRLVGLRYPHLRIPCRPAPLLGPKPPQNLQQVRSNPFPVPSAPLTRARIVDGKIPYPQSMSPEARDLIAGLCTVNPANRLGNISGGSQRVKAHPFFRGIDWEALYYRRVKGPIVPKLAHAADASNFDDYDPEPERQSVYTREMSKQYEEFFKEF